MYRHLLLAATILSLIGPCCPRRTRRRTSANLKLRDWAPKSMMVTKATKVDKPMFPVIDDHNHLGTGKAFLTPERVAHYLAEMDAAGVRTVVNLDGMWGNDLKETLDALDNAHPGRFLTFALINFDGDRRRRLEPARGQAAGREFQGRRQGAEVPQVARAGRAVQEREADEGRRSEARSDLGGLRQVSTGRS